jgi:hypothetical protein
MTNVIQILRSAVFGNRPAVNAQPYGVPYVNFADKQFGVVDSTKTPQDLVGVPYFSTASNYNAGQPVNYQGRLYIALVSVVAGAWNAAQWSAVPTTASVPSIVGQNRNRIINGHFIVDQYNVFAASTPTATAYVGDRWQLSLAQSSKLRTQMLPANSASFNPGNAGALQISVASVYTPLATETFSIGQSVEFQNITDFAFGFGGASPITLSFWATSNVAGTYSGSLSNYNNTRSYVFTFALAANQWTKFVILISGDITGTWYPGNANSAGISLRFDLGCGTSLRTATVGSWIAGNFVGSTGSVALVSNASGTLTLANVQLELGNSVSPFDWQNVGDTLTSCQRYYEFCSYQIFTGNVTSGFGYNIVTRFRVIKRIAPTIVYTDQANSSFPAGVPTNIATSPDDVMSGKTANATASGGYYQYSFTASAEL